MSAAPAPPTPSDPRLRELVERGPAQALARVADAPREAPDVTGAECLEGPGLERMLLGGPGRRSP
jgi:hypothetical protein